MICLHTPKAETVFKPNRRAWHFAISGEHVTLLLDLVQITYPLLFLMVIPKLDTCFSVERALSSLSFSQSS